MPLGAARHLVPSLINLCTFGSPRAVDRGMGVCPAWRTGWRDGVPAAHAGTGHCTTVPSPLRPQIHNFTSEASRSVTDCAGKAVLTSTPCPRYGAGQNAGDKWKGDLIAASRRGIWVCRITQPGSAELGNLKVHNRATTPCTAGQPGTLAHMILLNYWDSIERLSYALFGCPFMHFLLDKHSR